MSTEHVALLGFMAAGKSRIGRRLAGELQLPFIDTDQTITERHGSIAEIFAREGEAAFRAYEFEAVRAALQGPPAVVSLGGGAITHVPTRELLAENTLRIFLDVPFAILVARLRTSKTARPLAGAVPDEEGLRELLESRLPHYREAEIVMTCGSRSSGAIARRIAARLAARATPA